MYWLKNQVFLLQSFYPDENHDDGDNDDDSYDDDSDSDDREDRAII